MGNKPRVSSARVGQLFGIDLSRGSWGAAQIVSTDARGPSRPSVKGRIRMVALNWFGSWCPTRSEVFGCPGLIHDHHRWHGGLTCRLEWSSIPANFTRIGTSSELVESDDTDDGLAWFVLQLRLQERWLHIPEATRRQYQSAIKGTRPTTLDVRICEDSVQSHVPSNTGTVCIASSGYTQIDSKLLIAGEKPDWTALDKLDALEKIDYVGSDTSLLDYLQNKPLLTELRWKTPDSAKLDFSATHLSSIEIEAPQVSEIAVPSGCDTLLIEGSSDPLHVADDNLGRYQRLVVSRELATITGLGELRELRIRDMEELDCADLLGFPQLETLTIHTTKRVRSLERLVELSMLRSITIHRCYDLRGEVPMPNSWPHFESMEFNGLLKSDATTLKERAAGDKRLLLKAPRTQLWVKVNLENPFRHSFEHRPAREAKAAHKAYSSAVKAIAANPKDIKITLHKFVTFFNSMEGIDTLEREDICEVFLGLLDGEAVDVEVFEDLLDEWREF